MKTLAIENGDLVIGPAGHAVVAGTTKVLQDLRSALGEPYGCDRFHAQWGSLLDSYIGSAVVAETELLIRSEVTRIVRNYVALQAEALRQDALAGNRPRYGTNEVIAQIASINVQQEFDRFHVRISLVMVSGDQVAVAGTVAV